MPPFLILDSVTKLTAEVRDRVVVSGSHCGVYSAYLAAKAGLRAVILNDAGVGRDGAGIAGLGYLDKVGMPAAVVSVRSARIGEAADCARRGVISHVNALAAELGCRAGQSAAEAAALLDVPRRCQAEPPAAAEGRHRIEGYALPVWALDSASLVEPGDAGAILAIGSHGGLLGGVPATALKVDALAALYNDATGGIDDAGFSRLPVLDDRGIAAATVDAMRARIGDGRSTFRDGILTRVNRTAAAAGARNGMTARSMIALLTDGRKA